MPRPKKWKPTDAERETVEQCIGLGMPVEDVAILLHVKPQDIERECDDSIKNAKTRMDLMVIEALRKMIEKGDPVATMFYLKCKANWRDRGPVAVEVTKVPDFVVGIRDDSAKAKREE